MASERAFDNAIPAPPPPPGSAVAAGGSVAGEMAVSPPSGPPPLDQPAAGTTGLAVGAPNASATAADDRLPSRSRWRVFPLLTAAAMAAAVLAAFGGWAAYRVANAIPVAARKQALPEARQLLFAEQPPVPVAEQGIISGEIVNAVNNKPVPGAVVRILETSKSAAADGQGRFRIEHVRAGTVQVEVAADGFGSEQVERKIRPGQVTLLRCVLNPGMQQGQMRIVLTWDKEPKDLDAHLEGPLPEGKRFHVYYHQKGDLNRNEFVQLDVDCQDGEGPETITVLGVLPGTYRYWVHDYTHRDDPKSSDLAQSGAEVRLFQGGKTYRFHAGHDMVGNRWNVFTIEVSPQGAAQATKTDTYEGTKLESLGLYEKRTAANRTAWIANEGGSVESETGVDDGLNWLARHQHRDGYWANRCLGHGPDGRCEPGDTCTGEGVTCEMAHTGLALLAFQAGGNYYFNGQKYSEVVRRGLNWLVAHQEKNGALVGSDIKKIAPNAYADKKYMYEHGIATFALGDACASAKASHYPVDPKYMGALINAVRFLESQQHIDGGWRYNTEGALPEKVAKAHPNNPGRNSRSRSPAARRKMAEKAAEYQTTDASVTGWQVLALKSAKEAGVAIDSNCLAGIRQFFADRETGENGRTYYQPGKLVTDATTGVGMLAHEFLLGDPNCRLVHDAASYLAKEAPRRWGDLPAPGDNRDYYLWYNCSLAMFQAGGENWERWNDVVRDTILKLEEHTGCERGSWSPDCKWGAQGGRIFSTALAVLTLEVYYRYAKQNELPKRQQPTAVAAVAPPKGRAATAPAAAAAPPAASKPAKPAAITLDAGKFDIEVKEEKGGEDSRQRRKDAKEPNQH